MHFTSNSILMGCRSRSTTDIFKEHSLDETYSPPPLAYGATLTRTSSSVPTSSSWNVNRRRRRADDAPAPPQRSDSFAGVVPSALKRARADDDRRRLVETSTPTHQNQAQTPRSRFVRKLVASLERRQKEISGAYCRAADDEFLVRKNFERDETSALLENEEKEERIVERPDAGPQQRFYTYARLPSRQLEDLQEREHEEDDEEVDDFSDLDDEPTPVPELWSSRDLQVTQPILPAKSNNNDTVDPDPPKATFQRTIKNMLSSIFNWRSASKHLPRGSREYYAARESLGDEIGTFRKHTLPQLIERATSKGRLDRSRGETSRRDLREFTNFIGEPRSLDDDSRPSIATIHPMHGTLKRSASRIQEIKPPTRESKEVVYGSIKVQLPVVPVRQSSLPACTEHRLWQLPSKVRDLHKHSTAAPRMMMQEPAREASRASSVIYDVPRSSRWLPGREPKSSPPEYENIEKIVSRDKRARNSMFTNF